MALRYRKHLIRSTINQDDTLIRPAIRAKKGNTRKSCQTEIVRYKRNTEVIFSKITAK
jgi:hypothetical protein